MIDLLSHSMKRKFELLHLLESSDEYVHIQTIAWELDCSIRTAQEEIDELKDSELKDCFTIENRGKEFMLIFNPGITIDIITQYVMKESIHFQIIERTLYDDNLTVEALAQDLHISIPTIYRHINTINESLQKHADISFTSSPCRLHSDESNIRSFYIQYFSERYPVEKWPFKDIDEESLNQFLEMFEPSFSEKLNFSSMREIKIAIAISYIRYKNENYAENKHSFFGDFYRKIDNKERVDELHTKMFGYPFDIDMSEDIASYFLTKHHYQSYQDLIQAANTYDYVGKSVLQLTSVINKLADKYKMPIDNFETLVLDMHNAAQKGVRSLNARQILSTQKSMFVSTFKSIAPNMSNDIESSLKQYNKIMRLNLSDTVLHHLMYILITHWNDLLLNIYTHMKQPVVKLVSANDQYHAKIIQQKLKFDFDRQIDVDIVDQYLLKDILESDEADIIVTNFSIQQPVEKHVIAVSDLPTAKDMQVITKAIYEVQHESTKYL